MRGLHPIFPDARLLIFAKAPVPGQVKTRLIPTLSAEQAARLHARFIERTLTLACASGLCPVELWCSPDAGHPFFAECGRTHPVTLHTQNGADLGQRMQQAADSALAHSRQVLLIGCDCPVLSAADLAQALARLEKGYNAVLAPAEDGGYVLLGLRRAAPELFRGIAWGTDSVLDATRTRLGGLQWRWYELEQRWDVDRPDDLARLQDDKTLAAQFVLPTVPGD